MQSGNTTPALTEINPLHKKQRNPGFMNQSTAFVGGCASPWGRARGPVSIFRKAYRRCLRRPRSHRLSRGTGAADRRGGGRLLIGHHCAAAALQNSDELPRITPNWNERQVLVFGVVTGKNEPRRTTGRQLGNRCSIHLSYRGTLLFQYTDQMSTAASRLFDPTSVDMASAPEPRLPDFRPWNPLP